MVGHDILKCDRNSWGLVLYFTLLCSSWRGFFFYKITIKISVKFKSAVFMHSSICYNSVVGDVAKLNLMRYICTHTTFSEMIFHSIY